MKALLLTVSHVIVLLIGFALGIYVLPLLTAPAAPASATVQALSEQARFRGEFRRDLAGSDLLHWGEGEVLLTDRSIGLMGRLAPGPDYQLYLTPEFVETEADFQRVKARSEHIGPVKTFDNFMVAVPAGTDLARFNTVVVWCESFSQFISAARYR